MPAVPLARGETLVALTALIVIGLTYIKTKKFDAKLRYLEERELREPVAKGAISDTLKVRNRWAWLTYLR